MRLPLLAFVFVLSTASAAVAAPTCNDVDGRAVRCGTPGAMPVGWEPSPKMVAAREPEPVREFTSTQMFGLVCFLGGLMALFALLPDFEDGKGGGWDRQEDDEEA